MSLSTVQPSPSTSFATQSPLIQGYWDKIHIMQAILSGRKAPYFLGIFNLWFSNLAPHILQRPINPVRQTELANIFQSQPIRKDTYLIIATLKIENLEDYISTEPPAEAIAGDLTIDQVEMAKQHPWLILPSGVKAYMLEGLHRTGAITQAFPSIPGLHWWSTLLFSSGQYIIYMSG